MRDFFFGHVTGMPFVMVKNESLNPIYVRLLGSDAVMLSPNHVPHLLEKFWFVWRRHGR